MSRSITGFAARWSSGPSRWAALGVASTTAAAVGVIVVAGGGAGTASPMSRRPAPVVTRAALDPALVAGRGAERRLRRAGGRERRDQRHRHRPGPDGVHAARRGVRPHGGQARRPGSTSSSRCRARPTRSPCATASRTRRPAAASPRRSTSRSTAAASKTMTLTSQYAWLYNQYPFSNDPNAGLLHPDWWITECALRAGGHHAGADDHHAVPARCTSTTSSGCCSASTYQAGDKVRLTAPAGSSAAWTVIDLLDSRARRRCRTSTCIAANVLLLRRRPDRPARLGRRVRQGDRVRQEDAPQGLHPAGHLPGQPAHHRRQRDDRGRRQLVHDHQGPRGRARRRRRRTARCTPASASTASTRRPAAAATCTCPASRSRATCASASTPTRSTASAAR